MTGFSHRNFQGGIPAGGAEYEGMHQELNPIMGMLEQTGLIHTNSMEMTNDPRFFKKTVLNKRLAAFSSLSVVSGLMVGTSTAVISMKKNMDLSTFTGQLQFVSFSIMTMVMFANVVATYVGVAQVYHAYRLETAGPTGFEMATSYYLNPNIVSWRHLAIKGMLHSLPLFLISTGIRIQVSFEEAVEQKERAGLWTARMMGFFFMVVYSAMGVLLWYIHWKHTVIFRERYKIVAEKQEPYMNQCRQLMTSNRNSNRPLDV